MVIPIAIAALYVVAAGVFWLGEATILAAICVALAPVGLILTRYARRLLHEHAAEVYATDEKAQIQAEVDGALTVDTDAVPDWPIFVTMGLGLGSVAAVIWSVVGVLAG